MLHTYYSMLIDDAMKHTIDLKRLVLIPRAIMSHSATMKPVVNYIYSSKECVKELVIDCIRVILNYCNKRCCCQFPRYFQIKEIPV